MRISFVRLWLLTIASLIFAGSTATTVAEDKSIDKLERAAKALEDASKEIRAVVKDLKAPEGPKGAAAPAPAHAHKRAHDIVKGLKPVAVPAATPIVNVTHVADPASKVYFVLLANTDAQGIDLGVRSNLAFITSMTDRLFENDPGRVESVQVHGADFTRANNLAAVKAAADKVQANDVLFVYVATHGGYQGSINPLSNDSHMMVDNANAATTRSEFLALMKDKGRLQILLTDSCTSRPGATPSAFKAAAPVIPTYALLNLLFHYKGTVNISSSTPPQFSWYLSTNDDENNGGLLTRQFCISAMTADASKGWDGFFTEIRNGVSATASLDPLINRNGGQTPVVFPSN